MTFQAGFGSADMTAFIPGLGMMGYGQPHNIVKDVATPLVARALVLSEGAKTIYWVHLEQAFVSMAIKEQICARLGVQDHDLVITAQHTHSAPGGYSHFPFYNFTIPDFQLRVFNKVCSAIMDAIKKAKQDLAPVNITWGMHEVSADLEVAFNRSIVSYLANPDSKKIKSDETPLAINREMEGLIFHSHDGKLRGIFNWFGVHCTSVSSYNTRIHHDNKGIAAKLFEAAHPGCTAFFLQAAAGDVSPNFIWDAKLKRTRGKFADQYESTQFNGEIQFREAEKLYGITPVQSGLASAHRFYDMATNVAPPAHGVAFFMGTKEGPGVGSTLGNFLKQVSRRVRAKKLRQGNVEEAFYKAHDPKDVLLDHRTGSFLGVPLKLWKKLPPIPDPTVESFRRTTRSGGLETLPWVPPILPFQLVQIGQFIIAAVPGEITTIAAQRVKQSLAEAHPGKQVIISSYANAYMGYVTTPEEYRTQSYEAGHTIYGINTLEGIISGFKGLIPGSYNESNSTLPFYYPDEELKKRSRVS